MVCIISYTKENFQDWLSLIDIKMDLFTGVFARENNLTLNCSIESLDEIENWILSKFKDYYELMENDNLLDLLEIYIGETFRKHIGGKWDIILEDKKNAYYHMAVLTSSNYIGEVCLAPLTFATACISRNKGNYISTILKNCMKNMNIPILVHNRYKDDLPTRNNVASGEAGKYQSRTVGDTEYQISWGEERVMYTPDNILDWMCLINIKMDLITGVLARDNNLTLNYSIKSLDELENWILSIFADSSELIEEPKLLDSLAIYIGETFRKHIGGKWDMILEDKINAYYQPVLTSPNYSEIYLAPLTYATACISRNKGNYISTILKNCMKDMNIPINE